MIAHPQEVIDAARALLAKGAGPTEVARVITQRGYPLPASTVRYWKGDIKRTRLHGRVNPDEVVEMAELWEAGLSARAITVVMERYHNLRISEGTVKNHLPDRTRRPRGSQVGLRPPFERKAA